MAKKLKVEDIPEGYNYAAVDSDGWAYAYVEKPELLEDSFHGDYDPLKKSCYIGMGYDTCNWRNSLVLREAAERPQFKKLTAADIPDGYNFAAIDRDRQTYVYTQKPTIGDANWISLGGNFKFFSLQFDPSDWKNSLVSRETSELIKQKKLTTADIPEGYNYAAVDEDGEAFAYQEYPVIIVTCWKGTCRNPKFLGNNFDASDWENSLVARETEQKPEFKKLTMGHIPGGYSYAAVNAHGMAYAFDDEPEPQNNGTWDPKYCNGRKLFIGKFDSTDWENSVVPNETDSTDWENSVVPNETAQPETAYKETANKLSYSEIDPYFLEQMSRRMQKGKEKYGPNNWKKLSDINELLDAAQRHLLELRKMVQEDFEPLPGQESEAQHCAALACNAMFIHYHLNPNA